MNAFSVVRGSLRRTNLILALSFLTSTACVYRAPIQQGNLLDSKDIDQVTVGMTQAQVKYVLGTPMVSNPFSASHWDYVYYVKLNTMPVPKKQQLIVYFENGTVSKLERTKLSAFKQEVDETQPKAPWYKRWLNWIV